MRPSLVICLWLVAGAQTPVAPRIVGLTAPDGTHLEATYYSAGKPGPGVLLFHQSNRTRQSWDAVARRLAAAGINVLAVDNRAHGGSGGAADKWNVHGATFWDGDLETSLRYLISQPGVDTAVIGVGAAGLLGVDNAIETARLHPAAVKSMALLSGETFLPQLRFLRQAEALPGLFVVSDDDEYPPTVEAMEWLYITSPNPGKQFVHYSSSKDAPWRWYEPFDVGKVPAGGHHGTDLFQTHPDLSGIIVDWFVTTLITTPGHAPADAIAAAATLAEIEQPGGIARVTERLLEARRTDPAAELFPEVNVDIIGSDHLRIGEVEAAIAVYKLNLLAYPTSADAHSNLADAYLSAGQLDSTRHYAAAALAMIDSHAAPLSSWSDTKERRADTRLHVLKVLGQAR